MKKTQKIHLVIIDPQKDFMDEPGAALAVPGATADMQRLAAFINANGRKLEDIHVTMDSHQIIDIAHPAWWVDKDGKNAPPFTIISVDDIETGIWKTRNPGHLSRSLDYVRSLRDGGKYLLMVWPPHCLIGSPGYGLQADILAALYNWAGGEFAMIDFVVKGTNPFTEHYGALMAEVPDGNDPKTQLNTGFLETLQNADVVLVAGEALSHCVKSTMDQIIANIGVDNLKKIHILTDCTSSVAAVPGVDFPAISQAWLKDIEAQGVTLIKSTEFFN